MATKTSLKKPTKKKAKPYWDYLEVEHYLEDLHGKKFRDYAGRFGVNAPEDDSIPYQDFWHWVIDQNEVSNGCWIHLPEWDYYMAEASSAEPWQKEIMQYFKDFLGEDYSERLWVEW